MDFKFDKEGNEKVKLTAKELKQLRDAYSVLRLLGQKASGDLQRCGKSGASQIEQVFVFLESQITATLKAAADLVSRPDAGNGFGGDPKGEPAPAGRVAQ